MFLTERGPVRIRAARYPGQLKIHMAIGPTACYFLPAPVYIKIVYSSKAPEAMYTILCLPNYDCKVIFATTIKICGLRSMFSIKPKVLASSIVGSSQNFWRQAKIIWRQAGSAQAKCAPLRWTRGPGPWAQGAGLALRAGARFLEAFLFEASLF